MCGFVCFRLSHVVPLIQKHVLYLPSVIKSLISRQKWEEGTYKRWCSRIKLKLVVQRLSWVCLSLRFSHFVLSSLTYTSCQLVQQGYSNADTIVTSLRFRVRQTRYHCVCSPFGHFDMASKAESGRHLRRQWSYMGRWYRLITKKNCFWMERIKAVTINHNSHSYSERLFACCYEKNWWTNDWELFVSCKRVMSSRWRHVSSLSLSE